MKISYSDKGNSFDPFDKELESQGKEGAVPYAPHPIDLPDVSLPFGLEGLIEKLAACRHESWSAERMDEGWSYGPVRDDSRKITPRLVKYCDLRESDKDLDRKAVEALVKQIIASGYDVVLKDL